MKRGDIIPSAITALILIVLVISGSASAFIVDFIADKNEVFIGEKVIYNVKIDVEINDSDIDSFEFNIIGQM